MNTVKVLFRAGISIRCEELSVGFAVGVTIISIGCWFIPVTNKLNAAWLEKYKNLILLLGLEILA